MAYDARFVVSDDVFHRAVEILGLVALASAVVHIRPVEILKDPEHYIDEFALALSLTFGWLYNAARIAELYFFGEGQRAVIQNSALREARLSLLGLVFCLVATILAGQDYFERNDNDDGHRRLATEEDEYTNSTDGGYAVNDAYGYESSSSSEKSDLVIWLILAAPVSHYVVMFIQVVVLFPSDGSHKQFSKSATDRTHHDIYSYPNLFWPLRSHSNEC